MFGKISFGLSSLSKNTQNNNNNQSNNQSSLNVDKLQKKSFLSNPKFILNKESQSKESSNNFKKGAEKQQQGQRQPQKTKQIQKASNSNQNRKQSQKRGPVVGKSLVQHQMQGSKFRILNELLYTSSSQQAMNHFKQNPQDYQTYHAGYRYQSQKWETKPVNILAKYFRKSYKDYKDKIIADLGCGEGFLYEGLTKQKYQKEDDQGKVTQVKNKHIFNKKNILSFDLVSLKPFIKVVDIKNLPLQDNSTDVAVFCLSLMGNNYLQFIQEVRRVLKQKTGQLMIAEVQSRSKNWKAFVQMVQLLGFQLINNGVSLGSNVEYGHNDNKKVAQNKGKYFRVLHFVKHSQNSEQIKKIRHQDKNYNKQSLVQLSHLLLTECIYKKR